MTIKLNPPFDNAFYSRGMLYDKQGDVMAALKDYNKAIELNSSNGYAYNSRGLLFANRHFDSALKDYNESIRLNPNVASTYNNRGSLLFSQGNFEAALIDYTAGKPILSLSVS